MKKLRLIIIILVGLIIILHHFNIYTYYKISSTNMLPTFEQGQKLWGLGFLKKEKNDIVSYIPSNVKSLMSDDENLSIGRIVAANMDTVKITGGLLFINNKLVDDTMKLSYMFKVSISDIGNNYTDLEKAHKLIQINNDSVLLNFSYTELKTIGFSGRVKREIFLEKSINASIFLDNSSEIWSLDELGPFVVPKDSYFILGDNRGNSIDCRKKGVVKKNNVISKIII